MTIFPRRERHKAGKYFGVCLTVSVPSAVFVVEAVKKTAYPWCFYAPTAPILNFGRLLSHSFTKVHVKPVTGFSLCHTTPDDVNTRPCICFPSACDLPVSLSYLVTELRSSDRTRNTAKPKKKQWLTETPLLSSDAPPMCLCFAAALFGSQEVPEREREVARCAVLWQNVSTETGGRIFPVASLKDYSFAWHFSLFIKSYADMRAGLVWDSKMNNSSRNSDTWSKQHAPYLAPMEGSRSTL